MPRLFLCWGVCVLLTGQRHLAVSSPSALTFSRAHGDPGLGPRRSQFGLFPDGDHLWLSRHRGLPHRLGSDPRPPLTADVCDQCNLRFVPRLPSSQRFMGIERPP